LYIIIPFETHYEIVISTLKLNWCCEHCTFSPICPTWYRTVQTRDSSQLTHSRRLNSTNSLTKWGMRPAVYSCSVMV